MLERQPIGLARWQLESVNYMWTVPVSNISGRAQICSSCRWMRYLLVAPWRCIVCGLEWAAASANEVSGPLPLLSRGSMHNNTSGGLAG